jgi:hypothetical protein
MVQTEYPQKLTLSIADSLRLPADGHFVWDVPWQGLKTGCGKTEFFEGDGLQAVRK